MNTAQPPLPGAVTIAVFPSSGKPGVLELVRILGYDEKILLRRDVGTELPPSTLDRWEEGESGLFALRLQNPAGRAVYISWAEIMLPSKTDTGRTAVHLRGPLQPMLGPLQPMLGQVKRKGIPLHIRETIQGPVLGYRTRDVWIWVLLDLLDVTVGPTVAVQLGLPIVVPRDIEIFRTPLDVEEQRQRIARLMRLGTWHAGQRPYLHKMDTAPSWMTRWSKTGEFYNLRPEVPYIMIQVHGSLTGSYVSNPHFVMLGYDHFGDGMAHIGIEVRLNADEGPVLHVWPGHPDPIQAAFNAGIIVQASSWDDWLDNHMLPGEPVFDSLIYEALEVPNPMLGPAQELVAMLRALGKIDVP